MYTSELVSASARTGPSAFGFQAMSGVADEAVEIFATKWRGCACTEVKKPPAYTFEAVTASAETVLLASGFHASSVPSAGENRASRLRAAASTVAALTFRKAPPA